MPDCPYNYTSARVHVVILSHQFINPSYKVPYTFGNFFGTFGS